MKKVDVDGIEIRDNPIGGGTELCQNVCFRYRTARHGCLIAKTMKMTTCFDEKRQNRLQTAKLTGKVVKMVF